MAMQNLGYIYTITITTDEPLPNTVLDDCYEAVNETLAPACTAINYDTAVQA